PVIGGGALNFTASNARISFGVFVRGVKRSCCLLDLCWLLKSSLLSKLVIDGFRWELVELDPSGANERRIEHVAPGSDCSAFCRFPEVYPRGVTGGRLSWSGTQSCVDGIPYGVAGIFATVHVVCSLRSCGIAKYMSTSKTYQQSLAKAGSETRPPMLERGSYIPWASRFKRFLNRKRENQKWLLKALEDGPYVFRNITPTGSIIPRLQEVEDLQGDDLLYYDAEMELTNMILLSIPN
ncbi:hypothetical protein Tco_0654873, partial [Tanacetum coccineum]